MTPTQKRARDKSMLAFYTNRKKNGNCLNCGFAAATDACRCRLSERAMCAADYRRLVEERKKPGGAL